MLQPIGHLQVTHTMYKTLGRKLKAQGIVKRNEISFLHE
jgi:hypothetical protein